MMSLPPHKKFCANKEEEDVPNTQAFLNSLSITDAKAWKEEIIDDTYIDHINPCHLPATVTEDQLKSMKSIRTLDGGKTIYMYSQIFMIFFYFRNIFFQLDAM
jgi:hypothetical protein